MRTAAHRDDLLDQIRALPVEDRDYIEAALMREAYERGRHGESQDELAEIVRRAEDALNEGGQAIRENSRSVARTPLSKRSVRASRDGRRGSSSPSRWRARL